MEKRRRIPLEIVLLEEGTLHVLVPATAKGLENYWWVVDTGASKSVVDRAVAEFFVEEESAGSMATGLGQEMVETSVANLNDLRLGGIRFEPFQVAVVDLHHINDEYSKYSDKRIAGLLGSDFFFREKALIDYSDKVILL